MKKLEAIGPKKCTLVEVEKPQIKNDTDVLLKIKYSGVCMLENYDWSTAKPGMSFGHEPVGVVEAVGSALSCLVSAVSKVKIPVVNDKIAVLSAF